MNSDKLGDWRPNTNKEMLNLRAELLRRSRHFFEQRSVLEVETPVLSLASIQDPNIDSVTARLSLSKHPYFLHTSPELFMKRLLAAGSGDIYQICKVFRDGECGPKHNCEFTMVEWYRLGFDHHRLMQETADFCIALLQDYVSVHGVDNLSYQDLFQQYANIDPFQATEDDLLVGLNSGRIPVPAGLDRRQLLDLTLSTLVEPRLPSQRLVCVHGYPRDQASLSRIDDKDPRIACRFEVFLGSCELANGYYELCNAEEQRSRFEQEALQRNDLNKGSVPMDELFLAALESGLPDCAGVAVGFDRLMMLAAGENSLSKVISFPLDRK